MANDPAELLAQLFPQEMVNIDAAPPSEDIGALHAIYQISGIIILQYLSDVLQTQQQISMQEAGGPYLDQHGVMYGLQRLPQEIGNDPTFRSRLQAAINAGQLTIPAIQSAIQSRYASLYPNGGAPTVTVYDLQSNPTQCAADGTYVDEGGTTTPIVILDFVVDLNWTVHSSDGFFLDQAAYTDYSYLTPFQPSLGVISSDPGLQLLVQRMKEAGTHPVYRVQTTLVP